MSNMLALLAERADTLEAANDSQVVSHVSGIPENMTFESMKDDALKYQSLVSVPQLPEGESLESGDEALDKSTEEMLEALYFLEDSTSKRLDALTGITSGFAERSVFLQEQQSRVLSSINAVFENMYLLELKDQKKKTAVKKNADKTISFGSSGAAASNDTSYSPTTSSSGFDLPGSVDGPDKKDATNKNKGNNKPRSRMGKAADFLKNQAGNAVNLVKNNKKVAIALTAAAAGAAYMGFSGDDEPEAEKKELDKPKALDPVVNSKEVKPSSAPATSNRWWKLPESELKSNDNGTVSVGNKTFTNKEAYLTAKASYTDDDKANPGRDPEVKYASTSASAKLAEVEEPVQNLGVQTNTQRTSMPEFKQTDTDYYSLLATGGAATVGGTMLANRMVANGTANPLARTVSGGAKLAGKGASALGTGAKTLAKGIPKIGPLGAIIGAIEAGSILSDDTMDQKTKTVELSGVAGGLGGAAAGGTAGAALGATVGSIVPLLGTAVGGVIGGLVGSGAGYFLGEAGTEALVDSVYSWFSDDDEKVETDPAKASTKLEDSVEESVNVPGDSKPNDIQASVVSRVNEVKKLKDKATIEKVNIEKREVSDRYQMITQAALAANGLDTSYVSTANSYDISNITDMDALSNINNAEDNMVSYAPSRTPSNVIKPQGDTSYSQQVKDYNYLKNTLADTSNLHEMFDASVVNSNVDLSSVRNEMSEDKESMAYGAAAPTTKVEYEAVPVPTQKIDMEALNPMVGVTESMENVAQTVAKTTVNKPVKESARPQRVVKQVSKPEPMLNDIPVIIDGGGIGLINLGTI